MTTNVKRQSVHVLNGIRLEFITIKERERVFTLIRMEFMAINVTRELALKVIRMDFCGSICYLSF
jgi:hypothetical protein